MAKLRRNHRATGNKGVGYARIGIAILLLGMLYVLYSFGSKINFEEQGSDDATSIQNSKFLPIGKGQVIHHKYYSLSYVEEFEQAEWVAYKLTKKSLHVKNVPRSSDFRMDPAVKTRSAMREDYKRSGYSRGHLVPAGDMAFNKLAMSETFFMSNMSPQTENFNGGIWRELEEQVRDWVQDFGDLYVVCGPILSKEPIDYIGKNDVAVPHSYYKILLHVDDGGAKGIAYLIPHAKSKRHLNEYAVSIDEVEELTGLDFFPDLLSELEEKEVESSLSKKDWYFSNSRYKTRLNKWNKLE